MDYCGGGVLKQSFIVRNIQNCKFTAVYKPLQPLKRFYVYVVGRFVKQQHVRLLAKRRQKRKLYLFSAGKRAHALLAPAALVLNSKLPAERRALVIGQVEKALFRQKFRSRKRFFRLRQLLGKIAENRAFRDDFAGIFGVILHKRRVINQLEQGGFSVALLADEGSLFAVAKHEGKILQQRAQIFFMINCKVFYLKHGHSPLHKKSAFGKNPNAEHGNAQQNKKRAQKMPQSAFLP